MPPRRSCGVTRRSCTSWGAKRIGRLSQLLVSWNVTNDDVSPYQPAANLNGERSAAWAALLGELPPDVLRAVEEQIWDDYRGMLLVAKAIEREHEPPPLMCEVRRRLVIICAAIEEEIRAGELV